ncbi:MAG: PilZ domain-containing protein [candidate division Zixibacteria bacterium]|nr:PilZ domain-containing protein [candidate division Zixibacteria bacterium]
MQEIVEDTTQIKIRRQAIDALLVYDTNTKEPLGQVLDMSSAGMKLLNEFPANVYHLYFCRISLEKPYKGKKELYFDAECRWCNQDERTGWYYSGYRLRFASVDDADIAQKMMHSWMKYKIDKQNSKYGRVKKERRGLLRRIFSRKKKADSDNKIGRTYSDNE